VRKKVVVARTAKPAAIALLRQATALWPKREKASDGLLPSQAHIALSPNSDHNSGHAVDLTHDHIKGPDCAKIFKELQKDKRVKYLIFRGIIWSPEKGSRPYTGANPHMKHLHVSIKLGYGKDTSDWFPWVGQNKRWLHFKSKFKRVKVIKDNPSSPKED
jgi:hypothetical protein